MKKLLTLFVAFFAIISVSAQMIPNDEIWYTSSDGNVVTPFKNNFGDGVSIVSNTYQNGKGIIKFNDNLTVIGEYAFDQCRTLISMEIPNSVTIIEWGAFYLCTSLTSITIPNSVTTIEGGAFDDCVSLTSVVIPNSVEIIGRFAFHNCRNLSTVTLGNSVKEISSGAFQFCDNLNKTNYMGSIADWCKIKFDEYDSNPIYYSHNFYINDVEVKDLVIPEGVDTIGEMAFYSCSGLTTITIPNSVTTIGGGAFENCSLRSICVDVANTHYSSIEGVLFNYAKDTLIQYPTSNTRTTYAIPNSVTTIEGGAFSGCSGLTSITIPNSVTTIGGGAFDGCSGLTSITIPNSVTTIGEYTFYDCSSLASVTIGNAVTEIGVSAFYNCSNLKTVYNGSNLNIIKGSTDNGFVAYYADIVYDIIDDFVINKDTLVAYWGNEESITIPDGITIIGDEAFFNCSGLTSVTIPNSVKTIGNYAFYFCSGLNSVTIGNSVTTIGEWAFANCMYLTDIVLGANIQEIDCNAFAGDYRLENITCYAPITPNVCSNTFYGIDKSVVYLYVPADYQRKYQVDPNWKEFYLHLIGAEQKQTGDDVTVTPSTDNATFTWPANEQADGYSLQITKDSVVFCVLKFNAQGQLTSIAFAPGRGHTAMAHAATSTNAGWKFTVTGLNQASKYAYTLDALNASQQSIKHYQGEFVTDGYTDLLPLPYEGKDGIGSVKFIHNGHLLIERNGIRYNAHGARVK